MTPDDLGDRIFAKVPEVAKIMKTDARVIRKAIQDGAIPGQKIGGNWFVRTEWLREQSSGRESAGPGINMELLADLVADRVLARLALAFGPRDERSPV